MKFVFFFLRELFLTHISLCSSSKPLQRVLKNFPGAIDFEPPLFSRHSLVSEIPKTKSYDDPLSTVEKEKDMIKLKRDVFRLRNEMNIVKALLNKLYKKNYRKQKDFIMKVG